jgi:hypothetical protein
MVRCWGNGIRWRGWAVTLFIIKVIADGVRRGKEWIRHPDSGKRKNYPIYLASCVPSGHHQFMKKEKAFRR